MAAPAQRRAAAPCGFMKRLLYQLNYAVIGHINAEPQALFTRTRDVLANTEPTPGLEPGTCGLRIRLRASAGVRVGPLTPTYLRTTSTVLRTHPLSFGGWAANRQRSASNHQPATLARSDCGFRATVRTGGGNPYVDASTSSGGVLSTPHTPKTENGRPHINGCVRCEAAKTGSFTSSDVVYDGGLS